MRREMKMRMKMKKMKMERTNNATNLIAISFSQLKAKDKKIKEKGNLGTERESSFAYSFVLARSVSLERQSGKEENNWNLRQN